MQQLGMSWYLLRPTSTTDKRIGAKANLVKKKVCPESLQVELLLAARVPDLTWTRK